MATTKLIIRNYSYLLNRDGTSPIFVQYCHGYKLALFSTGEKVHIDYWDTKRQEVKKSKKGYSTINMIIKSFQEKIDNFSREAKLFGVAPTIDYIKESLKGKIKKVVPTYFEFIEAYIEEQKVLKKPITIRSYKTTFRQLKEYCDHIEKRVNYEDLTLAFYDSFLKYLFEYRNLSNNSAGSHIKNIKLWIGAAYEREYHQNASFKNKKWKVFNETSDSIYLNEKELNILYDFDLSSNHKLERVRNLFFISSYTALRFSDVSQLRAENIQNGYLVVNTKKTDERVVLPIHPKVQVLFDKYMAEENSPIPKAISQQKFNDYLKEIGKLVGFNQLVIIRETRGGKVYQNTYPKYELLSSHTARRSAATNLYKSGIPSIVIMKITGHRSESSFMKYIKLTQENAAEMLKNIWATAEATKPIETKTKIEIVPVSYN